MLKVFVIFLSLMLGGTCSALERVANYMAFGGVGAVSLQFGHRLIGSVKDHIASGGTEPLCCCGCMENSTYNCLEAMDRNLSCGCCCGYRKSNCGKCFDWLMEGLSIGTSVAACFMDLYANSAAQYWTSIACSGVSIFVSLGYFVGCFL